MKQVFLKMAPKKEVARQMNIGLRNSLCPKWQGGNAKIETLKAPERMNEEQEGTFNQHNLEGVNYFTPCYCYH